MRNRFSDRQGYTPPEPRITVREEAPESLRYAIITIAYEAGFGPSSLRKLICRMLRVPPDENNWSEYPNMDYEVRGHVETMPWYRVYDFAEAIYFDLSEGRVKGDFDFFASELNQFFRENGIGWQMVDGQIQIRGEAEFETSVGDALEELGSGRHPTAESELLEARRDLSRRPKPDLTGAVHHAMGALEALSRKLTGKPTATLGELVPHLAALPKPLDSAISKMWGYASETARHVREGGTPEHEEAELVVSTCASIIAYLIRKAEPN